MTSFYSDLRLLKKFPVLYGKYVFIPLIKLDWYIFLPWSTIIPYYPTTTKSLNKLSFFIFPHQKSLLICLVRHKRYMHNQLQPPSVDRFYIRHSSAVYIKYNRNNLCWRHPQATVVTWFRKKNPAYKRLFPVTLRRCVSYCVMKYRIKS